MGPLPYINGVIRADLLWTDGADSDVMSRLHFAYTGGPPSPVEATAIAAAIQGAAVTFLIPRCNDNVQLRGVDVIDLSGELAATGTHLATVDGSEAGNVLPAGVAVLLNHHVARRYRGGKPRTYLPCFGANDQDTASSWLAASVDALEAAWSSFIGAVAAITAGTTAVGAHVNVSYYQGYGLGRPRSNGHLYYPPSVRDAPIVEPITSTSVNPKPASQRRRNLHKS